MMENNGKPQKHGPSGTADLTKAALREMGMTPQRGRPGRPPDKLAKRFRVQTRTLLTDEDIQRRIRLRIVAELEGLADMKLLPTLVKIAAGRYAGSSQNKDNGESRNEIHFHLNQLSDDELKNYVERGIRPAALQGLPTGVTVEGEVVGGEQE